MGRSMTVRGVIETNMNDSVAGVDLALSYESPDRTKAWRVTGAWVWIDTLAQNTITSNNNPALTACLATDELDAPVRIGELTTASDNRIFGWTQVHYRGFDTEEYFVPNASTPRSNEFLIDFDRIVTNQLYIYALMVSNGGVTTPMPIDVNYMISLEEISIKPEQSVLQQLKGIGQDIVN